MSELDDARRALAAAESRLADWYRELRVRSDEVGTAQEAVDWLARHTPNPTALTRQQRTVLRYLAHTDLTGTQIAEAMYIGYSTYMTHAKSVYRKLGVGSRAQARAVAAKALEDLGGN